MNNYIKEMRKMIGHQRLILVGTDVFIINNNQVLLQKRRDNGYWSAHGGCVEIGETIEETAKRELLEETGLVANKLEFLGVFSGEDMLYSCPNGDEVCVVAIGYICDDFSGDMFEETDETTELMWFNINEMPDNINPPSKQVFRAFVKHMNNRN